jgi:hypothetical protein
MSAGETVSVRVPKGLPARIRAASGMPFSTIVRLVMLALDERYRLERDAGLPVDQVKADVKQSVSAVLGEQQ